MHYPQISADRSTKLWTQQFTGLDRRPRTGDGAFIAMGNMTGDPWPLLSSRKKRGIVAELKNPLGLYAMEKLAWIDGDTLYYGGEATPIDNLSLEEGMLPKRMVSMGAYLLIFPDGVFYNTINPMDYGSVNRLYQSPAGGTITYTLSDREGTAYPSDIASDTAPENPQEGDYWLDTSGEVSALYMYGDGDWIAVLTAYIKISAPGIGVGVMPQDGVRLSGIAGGSTERVHAQLDLLNNTALVETVDDNWIVTPGILDENVTQTGRIRADRKIPDMDFIIECNNRLWGCRHGLQDGETVNQIYACALGDFKNWQKFSGTSQDSYSVNVGSDGAFTGAVNHRGRPYFFKEKVCHMIYGDRPSNWQMQSSDVDGPQEGSGGTLAAYNGNLLYLSRHGVQLFDGMTQEKGEQLGERSMSGGAAAVCDNMYYLSVREGNTNSLYVMDCLRGRWTRQDDSAAVGFAVMRGEIYMLTKSGMLYALNGLDGTEEPGDVNWYAETAEMGYEYQNYKYLRRFILRMELKQDAVCRLMIQYDGDGIWHDKGTMQGRAGVKTYLAPIIPRRCEHARIRIEGHGKMRLYGLGRELAIGGDGR